MCLVKLKELMIGAGNVTNVCYLSMRWLDVAIGLVRPYRACHASQESAIGMWFQANSAEASCLCQRRFTIALGHSSFVVLAYRPTEASLSLELTAAPGFDTISSLTLASETEHANQRHNN